MNVLIVFHTPVNAGYAMSKLERTFFEVMKSITDSTAKINFSFTEFNGEHCKSLPESFNNIFELRIHELSQQVYFSEKLTEIENKNIDLALCFDLQVSGPLVDVLRKAGVKTIISYWGSTISSMNTGFRLLFKKLQVALDRQKPDLFIFESDAMRQYAVNGRGINPKRTQVIPTGVDTEILKPKDNSSTYLHDAFDIPLGRKVALYTGHMEKRKGVHVIINAFKYLSNNEGDHAWHLLVCGNRPGEEQQFLDMMKDHKAIKHVTFGGYRDDLPKIMPQCSVGIIASTGWDSFPMSSLEMAACGLPILASDLQGLVETIEDGKTGILFPPGDHVALAEHLNSFAEEPDKLTNMALAARKRIVNSLSLELQKERLINSIVNLVED